MDINIPIMNGLKVIELARMKHPDMAFVVVSGYDDFSYCREALRQKITDYILKPVNYEEFGACIDNLKIARFQKTVTEAPTEQGEPDDHWPDALFAGASGPRTSASGCSLTSSTSAPNTSASYSKARSA